MEGDEAGPGDDRDLDLAYEEALADEESIAGEGESVGMAEEEEEEAEGGLGSLTMGPPIGGGPAAASSSSSGQGAASSSNIGAAAAAAAASSSSQGYTRGEVASDDEGAAMTAWNQANPPGGETPGGDHQSVDGTSVQGGDDVRRAQHPSLTRGGSRIDESILCFEDSLAVVFPHNKPSNGGWMDYSTIFNRSQRDETTAEGAEGEGTPCLRPVRAMVFNIPKSAFRPDADRVRDMRSSMTNQSRATNINTLFGLLWTPVAKGWKCVHADSNQCLSHAAHPHSQRHCAGRAPTSKTRRMPATRRAPPTTARRRSSRRRRRPRRSTSTCSTRASKAIR